MQSTIQKCETRGHKHGVWEGGAPKKFVFHCSVLALMIHVCVLQFILSAPILPVLQVISRFFLLQIISVLNRYL